jgi:uncharacterized YccA/Bax inhibitor family protein
LGGTDAAEPGRADLGTSNPGAGRAADRRADHRRSCFGVARGDDGSRHDHGDEPAVLTLPDRTVQYNFPGVATLGIIVGIAAVFALIARPQWAKYIAPVYALGQGFAVGAISRYYNEFFDGIVVQAVGATLGVVAVMLVLYRSRIIRVTDRFRRVIVFATLGVMAFYLVSFVINLFGGEVTFLREPNLFGIAFSIGVSILAALNLSLDFDFIERGTRAGLSKDFEWYAAFGLLVTIVWLYLELLRLLALLQGRR